MQTYKRKKLLGNINENIYIIIIIEIIIIVGKGKRLFNLIRRRQEVVKGSQNQRKNLRRSQSQLKACQRIQNQKDNYLSSK